MKYKNNLNNWILEKINNNLKDIFILLLIFLLGIILGVLFVNNTSDYNKEKISTYINTFIVNMQEQNIDTKTSKQSQEKSQEAEQKGVPHDGSLL